MIDCQVYMREHYIFYQMHFCQPPLPKDQSVEVGVMITVSCEMVEILQQ